MHHIAPHAMHYFNFWPSFAYTSRSHGAEDRNQALQVQWRIGGPQASSGEDTNLVLDRGKPWCIPLKSLSFIFKTLFIILVVAILRFL
jgi:hypothetical protein